MQHIFEFGSIESNNIDLIWLKKRFPIRAALVMGYKWAFSSLMCILGKEKYKNGRF